jgi:hypothetical protein
LRFRLETVSSTLNQKNKNLSFLGLGPETTREELDATYHELVKAWHPDRFQNDEEEKEKAERYTREINVAYQSLIENWSEPGVLNAIVNSAWFTELSLAVRSARFVRGVFYSLSCALFVLLAYASYESGYLSNGLELLVPEEEVEQHRYSVDEFVPLKQEVQRSLQRKQVYRSKKTDSKTPVATLAPLDSGDRSLGSSSSAPAIVKAARICNLDQVKNLLKGDAINLEETDKSGETALSWAVRQGCEPVVNELLRAGADVNHEAENGFTPLTWATLHRRKKIADILRKSGAKPISGYWKGGTYHRGLVEQ